MSQIVNMKWVCFVVMLIATVSGYGQSTKVITGAVIDKSGNPIPNAVVEAKDGVETVMTEADGTFSIEVPIWLKALTAKYAGMGEKTFKLGNSHYALIVLAKRESKWFINAVYTLTISDERKVLNRFGLMGGYLGDWGGYAKILMPLYKNGRKHYPSISGGVIKRITTPFYLYAGIGYTGVYGRYDNGSSDSGWTGSSGAMIDIGAIYQFRKWNANLGYSYCPSTNDNLANNSVQFSVGYCF